MTLTNMSEDERRAHVETLRRQMQDAEVQWTQAILHMPTASSLLLADGRWPTSEEWDFFNGRQWPVGVELERTRAERVCCVINRMPALVAAALDADRRADRTPLGGVDVGRLRGIIVRQYRELQCLYNYVVSAHVEAIKMVGV